MKRLQAVRFLGLALVFTALSGCTMLAKQVGAEVPDTTPQRLAYLYGSLAMLRVDAANYLKQKVITLKTAEQVQEQANIVRAAADYTRSLYFSKTADPKEVERRLAGTEEALRGAAAILQGAADIYYKQRDRSK